jgi:predicted nucleic acid-binding protein
VAAVISNTSPIQVLHQTAVLHVLPALFGPISIPEAVAAELEVGRRHGVSLPTVEELPWLKMRAVRDRTLLPLVTHLGDGEKEVLALGLESPDALLLLDDWGARCHARAVGLARSVVENPESASQRPMSVSAMTRRCGRTAQRERP